MKPKNTDISPRSGAFREHLPRLHSGATREEQKIRRKIYIFLIYYLPFAFFLLDLGAMSGSSSRSRVLLLSPDLHSSLPSGCFQVPKVEELYGLLAFSFTSRGLFVSTTDHDVDRRSRRCDLRPAVFGGCRAFCFWQTFFCPPLLLLHVLLGCPWSRVLPEGR